jgi:hypothetical protein
LVALTGCCPRSDGGSFDGGTPDAGACVLASCQPPDPSTGVLLSELNLAATDAFRAVDAGCVVIDATLPWCATVQSLPPTVVALDAGCPGVEPLPDLLVSGVTDGGFYVLDRSFYAANHLDSGALWPIPGYDPGTGGYDLPGSWACLFVQTPCADGLLPGSHLAALSGDFAGIDGETQLSAVAWAVDPGISNPLDVPPPVAINPIWCSDGTPYSIYSDHYVCAPGTNNLQFRSLASCPVEAQGITVPSRWLDCDISGTGVIPYQPATGCMPGTNSEFCGTDETLPQCPAGQDCVASECVQQCASDSDCVHTSTEQEACIDGHCQNACLCGAYCISILDCSELSAYEQRGQWAGSIDGGAGLAWKLDFVTGGTTAFDPQESPGMVVDVTGWLNQASVSSALPWQVSSSPPFGVCCQSGSPGCDPDAGWACP